ncbi:MULTISPECIES: indolepyruvate ferredoxin oxidoreductase family protein [unclassified Sphingomonas]|uniref:indolepyruvate ferredoxin oxidoreductase family protein n=1 Tax=unclassified Sphingomonas TaxID=196159 RepID=UPI0006F422E8|nr:MULTISPECIES: indolepyruvate ferredoxin oxidoreductase family protein [unclassified Sphingomonas]KQX18560.1 hypothetical protein ASD17_15550 [Sphingomonas sp. Root1294]KQY72116.1 hypothetical protein ASD39_19425 [Sphingomonas sp. Root50]KRB94614.1 hypothetical protein ASE22_01330 [Sphingomonas sp. Root720]
MSDEAVTLEDRYTRQAGPAMLSGTQALVLLMMMQRRLDHAAGNDTAGFCSGYRGSPLSTLDQDFIRAKRHLEPLGIRFQGGINEALAATAVWGTQTLQLDPKARVEGVFGMWYGKGAGLDQSVDVIRHASSGGTSPLGGVLAVVGDDHALKSSAQPHHCEPTFADMQIPVLYPSDIGEIVRFGLHGYALSRFAGLWVGLKTVPETVNSTTIVDLGALVPDRRLPQSCADLAAPHVRWPDPWPAGERRFHELKLPRMLAYLRENDINRIVVEANRPVLGIVTAGKSYLDTVEGLRLLGLSLNEAASLGVSILKIGAPWPLEPEIVTGFAGRHPALMVVEEKRPIMEEQIKALLYSAPTRPILYGRRDAEGAALFTDVGEISPAQIALALARFLPDLPEAARDRARQLGAQGDVARTLAPPVARTPFFCSGCPHNSSTKVPEGSRAMAGIGCHGMAMFSPDRNTATHTHMGGEGATWIGQVPFTDQPHIFQNLGEGTYHHSGSLAIRAAVSAGVNITYKVLFNDAVAMTGGQAVDGQITVPQIAREMAAEGVSRIAIVAEQPEAYRAVTDLPPGTTVSHRDDLDAVQRELREVKGVSLLIYDQVCATEKRRRRKRGLMAEPATRVFINDLVCEGCGDCGRKSNCLSVVPIETEFGRKRRIDQSACNKDMSCTKGFCPSFVIVEGGKVRQSGRPVVARLESELASLPDPVHREPAEADPYGILIAGIGGTGVVTVGAILTMAARLDGLEGVVHDRMGMAQKFGAVTSHVRIGAAGEAMGPRIGEGQADLILGCDAMVTAQPDVISTIRPDRTHILLNTDESAPGAFATNPDFDFRTALTIGHVRKAAGTDKVETIDAARLATALTSDSIATNLFMLGMAFQRGLVPLSIDAIHGAIALNGVAVAETIRTFGLGRLAAHRPSAIRDAVAPILPEEVRSPPAKTLADVIDRRAAFLRDYQDQAYADRYRLLVERVRTATAHLDKGEAIGLAVARNYFKLLAYKDEYEVARLYAHPDFRRKLTEQFEGDYRLSFRLAPPLLARPDPATGEPRKISFGGWMLTAFGLLAKLRFLRGSRFDPFGYSHDRVVERRLIVDYERDVERVLDMAAKTMSADWLTDALALLALPERIRGYGPVKDRSVETADKEAELLRTRLGAADAMAVAELLQEETTA